MSGQWSGDDRVRSPLVHYRYRETRPDRAIVADTEAVTVVHLQGRLICRDAREAGLVATHLPRHVELTRAEQGCKSFNVNSTEDPLVWCVEEVFDDAASFRRHQDRVRGSEWGTATAAIERDYSITGL